MRRLTVVLLAMPCAFVWAQTASQQPLTTSDPQAITLAQQAMIALTRGSSINDVTLTGNTVSLAGAQNENGTGTFEAKGVAESRVSVNLSDGTRSEARSLTNGLPSGVWQTNGGTVSPFSAQNCWTDAAWFFPALSSLTQTANPQFVFKYIGSEAHNGLVTQHLHLFQTGWNDGGLVQRLSTTDVYLDPTTSFPLAVAFNSHADADLNTNLPVEIRFANYQAVNGVYVPFHFQKLVNGGVVLDVTVTNVSFNSGIPDTSFTLQ